MTQDTWLLLLWSMLMLVTGWIMGTGWQLYRDTAGETDPADDDDPDYVPQYGLPDDNRADDVDWDDEADDAWAQTLHDMPRLGDESSAEWDEYWESVTRLFTAPAAITARKQTETNRNQLEDTISRIIDWDQYARSSKS